MLHECHERRVVPRRLLAAQSDALEALELADGLLDSGTASIEGLGEEHGLVLRVLPEGDDRRDAACSSRLTVGLCVIALVGDGGARRDIGTDVEQRLEVAAVARLAAGQIERDRET